MADEPQKRYDVFLSHAHVDADAVRQLAEKLTDQAQLEVWLDQWVLVPGELWQQQLAKGIDRAASCAVCVGRKTPAGWFQQEIQRALNRQASHPEFRVIPAILPGGDPSQIGDFLELRTWVDFGRGLDDPEAMHRLVCGIKGIAPGRGAGPIGTPDKVAQLFTVPLPNNVFFTGREAEMRGLEESLHKNGIAALTGMPGMGKTQTAAQFAHNHQSGYPSVLWIRAESQDTLASDVTLLAQRLNLPERTAADQAVIFQAVKRWLEQQERWLLILDNVVEFALIKDLTRMAKPAGRHVVITTQNPALGMIAVKQLRKMGTEEGALLLRRAKLIGADEGLTAASKRDAASAQQIADELGGLPLALDQAGAYVEETQCSLADYHGLLRDSLENFGNLMQKRGGIDADHEPVAATYAISVERLAEQNPAAADVLRAAAFLAPDAMPEEIFTEGAAQFGEPLKTVAAKPLGWNDALAAAQKLSLLERERDKTISVHRTVQAVIRWLMAEEERTQLAEQVVGAVNSVFPFTEFANWPRCERLLPHAQACANFVEKLSVTTASAARLLNQTALYLQERARFTEAEPLMRRALAIDEKLFGAEHRKVAIRLSNLAQLLHATNRLGEAEPLMRRVIEIFERAYGPEHPNVATSLDNLAQLLKGTNRLARRSR